MYSAEYSGINSFLVGASSLLVNEGIRRATRDRVCIELPGPFMFKITNPIARLVTISERKWNPILPFAESLWLASGQNDLEFIDHYMKNMRNFSDDGQFLHGGYGPRLRKYNGIGNDYKIRDREHVYLEKLNNSEVDQFSFICKCFEKDSFTRRAIINIGDPPKDCFDIDGNLKNTKDFPCTRLLYFQKQAKTNKLDLTVYMRSNDLLWGASAVNIFNFTFMLEYFSQILNLEIGEYYHIANNFHYYEEFDSIVRSIAKVETTKEAQYTYSKSFNNLSEFDEKINLMKCEEEKLRKNSYTDLIDFNDDFFNDWYRAFYVYNTHRKVKFSNPIMEQLFEKYII